MIVMAITVIIHNATNFVLPNIANLTIQIYLIRSKVKKNWVGMTFAFYILPVIDPEY